MPPILSLIATEVATLSSFALALIALDVEPRYRLLFLAVAILVFSLSQIRRWTDERASVRWSWAAVVGAVACVALTLAVVLGPLGPVELEAWVATVGFAVYGAFALFSAIERRRTMRAGIHLGSPRLLEIVGFGWTLLLAACVAWIFGVAAGLGYALWVLVFSTAALHALAIDKRRALASARRVPEKTLHLLEFAGGFAGSLLAQRTFGHKVSKRSFRIATASSTLVHSVLVLGAAFARYRLDATDL